MSWCDIMCLIYLLGVCYHTYMYDRVGVKLDMWDVILPVVWPLMVCLYCFVFYPYACYKVYKGEWNSIDGYWD